MYGTDDSRRLSIGCVLVTLPSVLILDVSLQILSSSPVLIYQEPTSGLGSFFTIGARQTS
jgi:hypothetical protein